MDFISSDYLLNFLSYILPWLENFLKFMLFRLLENVFTCQKDESRCFYSCPQEKLSPRFLSGRWKFFIPPMQNFLKNLFPPAEKGRSISCIQTTAEATHWWKPQLLVCITFMFYCIWISHFPKSKQVKGRPQRSYFDFFQDKNRIMLAFQSNQFFCFLLIVYAQICE